MLKFKFYFTDGTFEYVDIDNEIIDVNLIDMAKKAFDDFEKNKCYRVDIVDASTNKLLSYYDDSECIVDGEKGHLIYDANNGDIISAKVDKRKNSDKVFYCFKFYFIDGTNSICGKKALRPEELYNDFDGLMEWEKY